MTITVIKGATIVDSSGETKADISIDSTTQEIIEVGSDLNGDTVIDATGMHVLPGFVDLHSHLRQPGAEASETIESGSRSAAVGGFTAVVAMPNTDPCMDSAGVIQEVINFSKDALCEVKPSGAITVNREGSDLAPMGEMFDQGVRMFTDDGTGVQDDSIMRTALEYVRGLVEVSGEQIVLSQHCEVHSLSKGGVMNEGDWSSKLGLGGQPNEAEEFMVSRDIGLARLTGAHIHFQHLSTAGSVEMVRQAKAEGLNVTAEATPHHFTLTDEACKNYDTVFKVHPPLRTQKDVDAIKVGLKDGTIDAIATDHAPHEPHRKELPFDQAPPGMIGLETAFGLANSQLDLSVAEIVKLMSTRPAEIAGLTETQGRKIQAGSIANLAIVDLNQEWVVDASKQFSRSKNTPFAGMKLKGKVCHTIFQGEVVVLEGEPQR